MLLVLFLFISLIMYVGLHHIAKRYVFDAVMTPLSSILGSGFLFAVPMLVYFAEGFTLFVLPVFLLLAWGVGSALRQNMQTVECGEGVVCRVLLKCDACAAFVLSVAYVISITFYISVLTSAIVGAIPLGVVVPPELISTLVILTLLLVAWLDGVRLMEKLSAYTVKLKVSFIISLIFLCYVCLFLEPSSSIRSVVFPSFDFVLAENGRYILAFFMAVQGFECCRYMGRVYATDIRLSAMRYAQVISALIFVLFAVVLVLLPHEGIQPSAMVVVDVLGAVNPAFVYIVLALAVLSQLGAAVADKVGVGCLIHHISRYKISVEMAFTLVAVIAIFLVWMLDVFALMRYATLFFCCYYAVQCFIASAYALYQKQYHLFILYGFIMLCMLFIAVVGQAYVF